MLHDDTLYAGTFTKTFIPSYSVRDYFIKFAYTDLFYSKGNVLL